jgi:flagellar basal body L-ring protein FlgH
MMKKYFMAVLGVSVLGSWSLAGAGNRAVWSELIRIADTQIPRKNVQCAINGERTGANDQALFNDVKVGDVLAVYLNWVTTKHDSSAQSFECHGNEQKNCSLRFGDDPKKGMGSQLSLNFRVNSKTGKIDSGSIECIETP